MKNALYLLYESYAKSRFFASSRNEELKARCVLLVCRGLEATNDEEIAEKMLFA